MGAYRFENCSLRADYVRRLIELQGELTPSDMVAIWEERESLPDHVVEQIAREITWMGYDPSPGRGCG